MHSHDGRTLPVVNNHLFSTETQSRENLHTATVALGFCPLRDAS
jgi:hypothetical protein